MTGTLACLCFGSMMAATEVAIEDGGGSDVWSHNQDGGVRPEWRADTECVHSAGRPALRVVYGDAAPHWGNLRRPVRVPAEATAIAFWLYVHRAAPGAAMHVWFFEPDGDGWLRRVEVDGASIDGVQPGWRRVVLPLAQFHFEPRGNKQRNLVAADRMLLGCNYADFEVTVTEFALVTAASVSGPAPTSTPWQIEPGRLGRAAVLCDPEFPAAAVASEPLRLGTWLREAGWGVTLLWAGDLADPERLNRRNFDLLVLAHGAAYPAGATENLRRFLQDGARWINLGGYAFDQPMVFGADGWRPRDTAMTAAQIDTGQAGVSLNTHSGRPGDTMGLDPNQIGVFDPMYQLEYADSAVAAPDQFVVPAGAVAAGPFNGFAAVAMTGSNSPVFPKVYGRWIPLLEVRDRFGQARGPLAAMVLNFDGPFRGSAWAFSGATNLDLTADPEAREPFLRVAEYLRRALFLHGAATDLACYRDGEPVRLLTRVSSFGPERQSVRVHFRIEPGLPDSGHGQVFAETRELTLNPGATVEAAAEWRPDRFGADFYSVEVKLDRGRDDASFEPWDVLRTGFVVWNQEVLRQGFPVRLHRNYFMDTTGRSRFLTGTNQTGMVWFSENENPLVWARDFEAMRDNGLRLLRFLHFSPFAAQGYEGKGQHTSLDLGREPPLRLQRQTDALVQLLQKHGVACFLSLHDWVGVELTDAELEAQRIWAEFWTRRYREVPGMFYDVQNEPSVSVPEAAHVVALWNDWLVARHGSRQGAWQAWAGTGEPPAAFDVKPGPGTWDDLKSLDLNLFKTVLLNRWARANRQGIKAGAPEALLTIGYLPSQPPADKLLGAAEVDFSNTHYYGSRRDFLLQLKFIDRRFEGKSLSVGEFGAQVNHDARVNGQTGDRAQASAEWFLLVTHGAFALGGSFVANWDWKEFQDCVFPWGIRYADLNPKPVAGVYRCAERLLGSVAPFYRSPAVYLVVPDSHRLGATSHEVHAGVCRALDLLLQCQVDFGVVNEWALTGPGQGVPETRALMWPLPYCPDDATFDCLRSWVEAGGCLYVSGDVQFDARRQPTRADRRAQLGLPAVEPRPPHETPAERWTQPPLTVPVGQGKVFYVAAPVELREQPANRDLYLRFLEWAGVARVPLGPDNRALVTGTLPLEDGGVAWVVLNTGSDHATVTWAGPAPVTLNLGARRTGFAAFDGRGSLRALEAQGEARVADTPVVTGDGHWMLLAEGPDADLRRPTACLLMALTPGTYVLPSLAAAPCAWEAEFRVPKAGQSAVLARHPLERRPGNWVLTVPPELVASEVLLRAK